MMTAQDKENAVYRSRIDEIYEQFKKEKTFYAKAWVEQLTRPTSEKKSPTICIWGAGALGHDLYSRFFRPCGVNISAFCDSEPKKWGEVRFGTIPVVSPQELLSYDRVVVAAVGHEEEIRKTCLALGIEEENIFVASHFPMTWYVNYLCSVDKAFCELMVHKAKEILEYFGSDRRSKDILTEALFRRFFGTEQPITQDEGTQYFISELPLRPQEAFVDAGAYNGDTLQEFVRQIPTGMSQTGLTYYAFECGKENYEALQQNIKRMDCEFPVKLYPLALWDKTESLNFSAAQTGGEVDDAGEEAVMANRLDDVLAGKRVSWIKMDIEGAEMRALAGCASIIKNQKPRLAICVYHKGTDLYEIPQYIKSLRDDYQMLLRHHSWCECETVIYAY